jgi:hypothetical protein
MCCAARGERNRVVARAHLVYIVRFHSARRQHSSTAQTNPYPGERLSFSFVLSDVHQRISLNVHSLDSFETDELFVASGVLYVTGQTKEAEI